LLPLCGGGYPPRMDLSHAIIERAGLLIAAGKRDEADELLQRSLMEFPTQGDAWAIRGQLEMEAGRHFNAMLHYNNAVKLSPVRHDFWCNRGLIGTELGLTALAEDDFRRSIEVKDNPESRLNLGNLYVSLMRLPEAEREYERALELGAGADAHAALGRVQIALGNWESGWQHFRHRFGAKSYPRRPDLTYPLWRGEPLEGKTILLYSEQGFGDEIMSLRFAETCKARGARVILAVRLPMWRLANSMIHKSVDQVMVQFDEPMWPVDYCCALLDVPAHAKLTPETIPGRSGYLSGRRTNPLDLPDGFKIGVCWATGKRPLQPETLKVWKAKTLAFEVLAPLARAGVVLVNLTKDQTAPGLIDPMPGVQDFADTAWIMEHLDLIVTVDTSVAHLAGALGKPVYTLGCFNLIWPWGTDDGSTIWYDSMKLYRQPKIGDWKTPVDRLLADLRCVAGS
jgi:Glycosyltransferase family 9 (heptosyltransferase)/Tetratricopeptide repeat